MKIFKQDLRHQFKIKPQTKDSFINDKVTGTRVSFRSLTLLRIK